MLASRIFNISFALLFLIVATVTGSHAETNLANESDKVTHSSAYLAASSLMKAGDNKKAITTLLNAQAKGENTFEINQLLVESYVQRIDQVGLLAKRGLAKKLRKAMEYSLQLKPASEQARENLIEFHIQAPGIVGGSKDKARELVAGFPESSSVKKAVFLAKIDLAQKKHDNALAQLEQGLAQNPQNANLLTFKGNILLGQKSYPAALLVFEECILAHPDNAGCHYLIGKSAHVSNQQTDRGITALNQFFVIGHKNEALIAHANYRIGSLLARAGRPEKAREHFQKAIAINQLDLAKQALAELK